MFEVRPARPEEMDEFRRVAGTALVMKPSVFEFVRPDWTLCGVEESGLCTTLGTLPLNLVINGVSSPVSGVTSVGSLPVSRRRGHLRRVMARHFEMMHEKGEQHIAALWASWAAIYQRFGYGLVATRLSYAVEPRYIQFAEAKPATGTLREAGDSDAALIEELYGKFVAERTGYIARARGMWQYGVMYAPPVGGTLSKVIYEEAGKPQGYIIYHTQQLPADPIPNHKLLVRDLVWLNSRAYCTFWEHLSSMDLIQEIDWPRAPSDDPLPHLLLEPRRLRAAAYDSILARLVTVEKALTQRRYTEEGDLTFDLTDAMCPWNTGRWRLEATIGGSRVTRTRKAADIELPVGTLALLLFGQVSATEAARMGRLDAKRAEALAAWDRVMRTMYKPACPDMF